jgi:hypothetical protein
LAEQRLIAGDHLRDCLKQVTEAERPKGLSRSRIPIRSIEAFLREKSTQAKGDQWHFIVEVSNLASAYDKICAEMEILRNSVLPGPPKSSHRFTVPRVITKHCKSQQKKKRKLDASNKASADASLMVVDQQPSTSANRRDESLADDVKQMRLRERSGSESSRGSSKSGAGGKRVAALKASDAISLGSPAKGRKTKVRDGTTS